jgi:Tfp pilus assembly protein PilN
VRPPLNLAQRPFRNERLPTLLLGLGILALAVLSVWHALAARGLRHGRAGDVEREVAELEQETRRSRAEAVQLSRVSASADQIKEWQAVKELVDRRVFSWSSLLTALEQAMPPGVRIVSVAPSVKKGALVLTLQALGRSVEDALALPKALEAQGEFEGAFPEGYAETTQGVTTTCTVRYRGPAGGAAAGGSK